MQYLRVFFLIALLFLSTYLVKAQDLEDEELSLEDADFEDQQIDMEDVDEIEMLELDSFQSPPVDLSNSTDTTGNITGTTDTNSSVPVTSPPAPVLKPARIYTRPHSASRDGPLFGAVPANYTKPHITPHIYGGEVRYRKGRNGYGCPCKEQLPEKYRYDIQLKDRKKKDAKPRCHCGKPKKKKSKYPPIVAALYPKKERKHKKACKKHHHKKKVAKVAPEYKPAQKKEKKKPCKKEHKKKKHHITPEFYPPRNNHKHKGRIVKKLATAGTAA